MRKIICSLLGCAALVSATDVSFKGSMTADLESNLDKSWVPHNSANQDITLTTRAAFDEKTAVELYITNYSTVTDTSTGATKASVVRSVEAGRSASFTDGDSRWGNLKFDGIQFQWEFSPLVTLQVGDLTWSGGSMNYYGYSWAQEYGTIMKETYVRGVGFQLGEDAQVSVGAPDANNKALWGYASYGWKVIQTDNEKWLLKPMGDLVFKNGGRNHRWTLGSESEYSRSMGDNHIAMKAAWGMRPYDGASSHTFLIEPSFNHKRFSLAGTFYQAKLARKNDSISLQTDIPEQQFAYLEPSVEITQKFSVGVSGEWHNPSLENTVGEYYACVPTFYLYPSEKMDITFWGKYQWMMHDGDLFGLGMSAKVNF